MLVLFCSSLLAFMLAYVLAAAPEAPSFNSIGYDVCMATPLTNDDRTYKVVYPRDYHIDDFTEWANIYAEKTSQLLSATYTKTGEKRALKTIEGLNPEALIVVRSEECILQNMHHPFMPIFYGVFIHYSEKQAKWFTMIVMEYINGISVTNMTRNVPVETARIRLQLPHLITEVPKFFQLFHMNDLALCDFKDQHVFITNDNRIKIVDYGAVMKKEMWPEQFFGSDLYVPPEALVMLRRVQAETIRSTIMSFDYDIATVDWYAFGIVLYLVIVGRYPFDIVNVDKSFKDKQDFANNEALEGPLGDLIEGLLRAEHSNRFDYSKVNQWIKKNRATLQQLPSIHQ